MMGRRGRPRKAYEKSIHLPTADVPVADARTECKCGTGNYCHRHRAYNLPYARDREVSLRRYESRIKMPPLAGRPFGHGD